MLWTLILFYSPFGLMLCLFRLVVLITFMASALLVLPKSWSRSLMVYLIFPILGWRYIVKHQMLLENIYDNHRFFIVCLNHVSYLDSVMLLPLLHAVHRTRFSLLASTLMGGKTQWEILKRAGILYETIYTKSTASSPSERMKTREAIRLLVQSSKQQVYAQPLVFFPEGQVHNCDRGLLRYEKFCFGLGYPVVPVALTLRHPWPVNFWVVGEHQVASWFYILFFPWLQWKFRVLPPIIADQESSDMTVARMAQERTALALGVTATHISLSEITDYLEMNPSDH